MTRFSLVAYPSLGELGRCLRAHNSGSVLREWRLVGIVYTNDDLEDDFTMKERTRGLAVLESVTPRLLDVYY